ncbi:MAG: 6-phosphogluconolactonase [Chloroflexi bacterium]|nr:6-phosphogluconolactonase [Chloroflexota bacterium]
MTGYPGEPVVLTFPTADAAFDAAADAIARGLAEAVARRGRADWATTGGSTAPGVYRRLAAAPRRALVPWQAVHVWFGDDRFVSRDHPLSNVLPVDQALAGFGAFSGQSGTGESGIDIATGIEPGAMVPVANVHAFPTGEAIGEGHDPAWAAARYEAELRAAVAAGDLDEVEGWPAFDVFFLGIGTDGHVLSVFPRSNAWDAETWAMGIPAPTHVEPHVPRVTLHPEVLRVTPRLIVVAVGDSKVEPIGHVFGERVDVRTLPAQTARRAGALWILDAATARELPTAR